MPHSVVQIQHAATHAFLQAPHPSAQQIQLSSTMSPLHASIDAHEEDAFKLVPVSTTEFDDTTKILAYAQLFRHSFIDSLQQNNPQTTTTTSLSSSAAHAMAGPSITRAWANVERALHALRDRFYTTSLNGIHNDNNNNIHDDDHNDDEDEDEDDHHRWQLSMTEHRMGLRQTLLERHGFIEILTKMLQAPFETYNGPFSIAHVSSFRANVSTSSKVREYHDVTIQSTSSVATVGHTLEAEPSLPSTAKQDCHHHFPDAAMTILHRILSTINVLLFRLFSSTRNTNALVLACSRTLPVLMTLLGHGFKASMPLSYLLQEKVHAIEPNLVSTSLIVQNFLDLIAAQGKQSRYLHFLTVLCTTENRRAVPHVQEHIVASFFARRHDKSSGPFLIRTRPTMTGTGLEVLVDPLKTDGTEQEWISIAALYRAYYEQNVHGKVAHYFYGLLKLYTALCLDRNYTCIHFLQDQFPRDALLGSVQGIMAVVYHDSRPIGRPSFSRMLTCIHTHTHIPTFIYI